LRGNIGQQARRQTREISAKIQNVCAVQASEETGHIINGDDGCVMHKQTQIRQGVLL